MDITLFAVTIGNTPTPVLTAKKSVARNPVLFENICLDGLVDVTATITVTVQIQVAGSGFSIEPQDLKIVFNKVN